MTQEKKNNDKFTANKIRKCMHIIYNWSNRIKQRKMKKECEKKNKVTLWSQNWTGEHIKIQCEWENKKSNENVLEPINEFIDCFD